MKATLLLGAALLGWAPLTPLGAQVPPFINYQGRVAVGGTNFDGTGQFKFALVNSDASVSFWSHDGTSTNGSEPLAAITLPVSHGLYAVRLGDAALGPMIPIPATVFTNPDVRLRVWFNDGVHGFQHLEPDQRIAAVGYALVAGTVPDGSITTAQLAPGAAAQNLQSSGLSSVAGGGVILSAEPRAANLLEAGFTRLGKAELDDAWDHRPGAEPPAARGWHTAVWTGTEMIVWGGQDASSRFDSGGRYEPTTDTWAATALAGAPAARSGHTAVWTGTEMIVWGGGYLGGGYDTGGRYDPAAHTWTPTSTTNAPAARSGHTAIWTGTEMIVWGGGILDSNWVYTRFDTGARYDPATDSWTAISTNNVPTAREAHSAVWTGTEMIIWGGFDGSRVNSGARYRPDTDTWTPLSASEAPDPRSDHAAVWTGTEMVIWGGQNAGTYMNSGGRFNPSNNTWIRTSTNAAPGGRINFSTVWTGTEMIVWGGRSPTNYWQDGGRYQPASDTWSAITTNGAPRARTAHSTVWTGTELIVWGGEGYSQDGGRYHLASDRWSPVGGAPAARASHVAVWTGTEMMVWGGGANAGRHHAATESWRLIPLLSTSPSVSLSAAVWTGTEMIVWGGRSGSSPVHTGGRYDPALDYWTPISISESQARYGHTAVWTGTDMLIWGGTGRFSYYYTNLNTGLRYRPPGSSWGSITTNGAPFKRSGHSAVWTGSEMIIWGGVFSGSLSNIYYQDGARYDPVSNRWTDVNVFRAPEPRSGHTAVWTGREMIVWGGQGGSWLLPTQYDTGARYDPVANAWTPMTTNNAPAARSGHTAIWTGKEMIVWGGSGHLGALSDGGRYDPETDRWFPTTLSDAPLARSGHTAVWTGTEMLVFGGGGTGVSNTVHAYTPPRAMYLYLRP